MSSLEQAIKSVAGDNISGSLGLVQQLYTAIENHDASTLSIKEKEALQHFASTKKQFAVVNHFVAFLLKVEGQDLQSAVSSYRDEWGSVTHRIARKAISKIEPATRFLIHSHSEMIVHYFELASSTQSNIKIWQTVSWPEKEGEVQATRLKEIGLHVRLIQDNPDPSVFQEIDALLCGADAISTRSFINKVGTRLLATKTQEAGKKVFVLADPRKRITSAREYRSMIDSMDSVFEEIPSGLVSEFIDEL